MRTSRFYLFIVFALSLALLAPLMPSETVEAQDDSSGVPIGFNGAIESIDMDTQVIVVAGLDVDISNIAETDFELEVGSNIEVIGVLQDGIVIAAIITLSELPEMTPELEVTPDPEMTPEVEITPEITVTPDPESTPEPTGTTNIININNPIIVIEGPVQEINVNIITIFNFHIQIDPSDPILTTIQIGDNLRIEGDMQVNNGVIIIIAITVVRIEIIQPIIINPGLPSNCRVTRRGRIRCSGRGS